MKIKQRPEDFVVKEIGSWTPDPLGPYSVYRLTKRGIGTLEAVDILGRMFGISRKRISFGGLKDRHSESEQLISIRGGPARSGDQPLFRVEFLGRAVEPVGTASFRSNHFTMTIRDLKPEQTGPILERLKHVREYGTPNYFDDQRFGSLRGSGKFIARSLIAGDFETALKLAIASPSAEDQKTPRAIKKTVLKHWGNWDACKRELPRSSERSIVTYLVDHPARFARAYELINHNLRIMHLSAYQSYLWNRTLSAYLGEQMDASALFPYPFLIGDLFMYHTLPSAVRPALASLSIPLPTRTTRFEDGALARIAQHILNSEGLTQADLKIRGMKQAFFSKGMRKAVVVPEEVGVRGPEEDDLNRGMKKLTLTFALPRGSYATILIKRLTYDMETRQRIYFSTNDLATSR